MEEFEHLEAFLADINRLKQAQTLLEEVWSALGPYFTPGTKLPTELQSKLQQYFRFDDGE